MKQATKDWLKANVEIWERQKLGNHKHLSEDETKHLQEAAKELFPEKTFPCIKCDDCRHEMIELVFSKAAKIEAKALEDVAFQIRLQDIADKNASEQEIRQALLAEQYAQELALLDQSLADKAVSEGVYLQKKVLAEKKFSSETKKNDKVLAAQKQSNNVQMINDSIGALQAIFGESKALAVASALMNTYQGITAGVKLGYPMAIPAVLFAAATGFAAVKNILKTNKDSTSMDTSAARPVTTSGTGSFVNTAQTETVARVSDTPQQQQPIVTPPVLILESLHEAQNNLAIKVGSS